MNSGNIESTQQTPWAMMREAYSSRPTLSSKPTSRSNLRPVVSYIHLFLSLILNAGLGQGLAVYYHLYLPYENSRSSVGVKGQHLCENSFTTMQMQLL